MSENTANSWALVTVEPGTGLTIETKDGGSYELQPGESLAGFLNTGGGGGQPLWTLKIGQHNDRAMPEASGVMDNSRFPEPSFYLTRNKRTGETKEKEFVGPIPGPLMAYAVGFRMGRTLFVDRYDENKPTTTPDCQSTMFTVPDADFKGRTLPLGNPRDGSPVIAHQCAVIEMTPTGQKRLVEVCPFAEKRMVDGKFVPPRCQEQYIVCLVIPFNGAFYVAEAYFKSMSAGEGKTLISKLDKLRKAGHPLWAHPVELNPKAARNVGNTFIGVLREDRHTTYEIGANLATEDAVLAAVERWQEALDYLTKKAHGELPKPAEDSATDNNDMPPWEKNPPTVYADTGETVIDVAANKPTPILVDLAEPPKSKATKSAKNINPTEF